MSKLTSDTHIVGGGYCVRFSLMGNTTSAPHIQCTWTPHKPTATQFKNKVDETQYQAALRQFASAILAKGSAK